MTGDNHKLTGTWRLVSASSTDTSGAEIEAPYGANPVGLLTYTEDGRVTALISYGARKPLNFGAKGPALLEEQAEAFKTFLAYAGQYQLSGDKVIHYIEISSIQNYVNKELVRSVKFQGNQIVLLTPPTMANGRIQIIELVWQRFDSNFSPLKTA
jgi:Lipocalin-like domain